MKYEFTQETARIEPVGVVFKRIRHLKTGKLGGFIESERNLSHLGEAWVSDNAWVGGFAFVTDDAEVSENAKVGGYAVISGRAKVSGRARVDGFSHVSGKALVAGVSKLKGQVKVLGDAQIYDSVLQDRVTVCHQAKIWDSELSGDVFVGGFAQARHCVLKEFARLRAYSKLSSVTAGGEALIALKKGSLDLTKEDTSHFPRGDIRVNAEPFVY